MYIYIFNATTMFSMLCLQGVAPLVLHQQPAERHFPRALRPWLALSFGICLALNTAAYEVWLHLGMGNANFFYGMNLLWAAWQAVALVQLLKAGAAAAAEEEEEGEDACVVLNAVTSSSIDDDDDDDDDRGTDEKM